MTSRTTNVLGIALALIALLAISSLAIDTTITTGTGVCGVGPPDPDCRIPVSRLCPVCGGSPPPIAGETGGCPRCASMGRIWEYVSIPELATLLRDPPAPPPPPPPPPDDGPPAAIVCREADLLCKSGVFHRPREGHERRVFRVPRTAPLSGFVLEMDVKFGGWVDVSKNHAIAWVHGGPWQGPWNGRVWGYLNLFSPPAAGAGAVHQRVHVRRQAEASNVRRPLAAAVEVGRWYHLLYTYDAGSRSASTVITDSAGGRVAALTVEDDTFVELVPEGEIDVVVGHGPDEAGPEVPTYGWEYANLRITE